jgi:hypothetical protein
VFDQASEVLKEDLLFRECRIVCEQKHPSGLDCFQSLPELSRSRGECPDSQTL